MKQCWRVAYLAVATVVACATVPDAQPYLDVAANDPPRVEGPRGPLSTAESKRILDELRAKSGDSDVLGRHLAIEAAVASSPLVADNKATLLEDGPATFKAMLSDIRAAKHHVNAEFFIVDSEGVGKAFAEIVIEKRRQGVEVNLIYDAVGSISTPREYFDRLAEAGVNIVQFHPLNPVAASGGKLGSPNQRDHRKILVVDGRIAYTGGLNLSSVYGEAGGSAPKKSKEPAEKWRDTHVRLEGPIAAEFQKLFLAQWRKQGGPELREADFFPKLGKAGDTVVHAIWTGPDEASPEFLVTFLSAVQNAEKRIAIMQAYFAPPAEEIEALKDAARRGVEVELILPQKTDQPKVVYAGRSHYTELLEAGIHIYERRDVLLHSKTTVIDGVWSVVGSANLDYRSVLFNDEANAIILGTAFGAEMEKAFARDREQSDRIDPKEWAERSFFSRAKEWLAHLFETWI